MNIPNPEGNNSLKIFHLNIRSIRKNFDELVVYLSSLSVSYHIIALTEIWLKSGEEGKYQLPGYKMVMQERTDSRAGGVAVYLDSSLTFAYQLIASPTAEIVHLTISLPYRCNNGVQMSLYVCYRSCQFTFKSFQPDLENILRKSSDPTVIIGDLNVCTLKNTGSGPMYLNLINSYGFKNYITTPTRIVNNSVSCLDHVLVRNSKDISFNSNVEVIGITDHYALTVDVISNQLIGNKGSDGFIYRKVLDTNLLRRQLLRADWSCIFENDNDINESISDFYKIYNSCYNLSCSLRRYNSHSKKRTPWISDNLVYLINRKNKLFKLVSKNRNNLHLVGRYKDMSRLVTREIRKEKINYYSSIVDRSKGDTKQYWAIVRNIMKKDKKGITSMFLHGREIDIGGNEELIANYFNDFFVNVIGDLKYDVFGCDLFPDYGMEHGVSLLNTLEVTRDEIFKIIREMKNINSSGVDGINVSVLKENIDIFAPLLWCLLSRSLRQGKFPDAFKVAAVVPVYKSGAGNQVNSYRPISLINTSAKVFEIFIKDKLLQFFVDRNIFSPSQFGFLPGRGSDICIESHVTSIVASINENRYTCALYLDLQKAFDVVDVDILIAKLNSYGIGGSVLKLLCSFCKDRRQCVKINGVYSSILNLRFGVAQGGVLGPIVFILYLNDLLKLKLNSSIFSYADDTALVCSAFSRQALKVKVQDDLDKISGWLTKNRLLVNASKSKCILFFDCDSSKEELADEFSFRCHRHQCLYSCSCDRIEIVSSVKYLGIYMDEHLKWKEHVNYLVNKLRKINYSIYFMRNYLKKEHLKQLYFSWAESAIRYGIVHYGGTYPYILKPLIMIQRMILRTMLYIRRHERVSYVFVEHNIFTFDQLYLCCCATHIFKFLSNYRFNEVTVNTRASRARSLEVGRYRLEKCRRQFCFSGKIQFNKIINHFGNSILQEKKPKFKMKIKYALRNRELMPET